MSDDSYSDFEFGSSSPLLDDEDSTTTQELVVVDEHEQEQQEQEDIQAVIIGGDDKHNEEQEQEDIRVVNEEQEQDNIQAVEQQDIQADDDKHNEEKEQEEIQVVNEEQEQDDIQVVNEEEQEQDDIQAVNEEEQEQDDIQVVNEEEQEQDNVQEVNEGYSGVTKKRRQFTLQEKLMYLWVICQKVDKGFSLWEASKSINISHKQILKGKKQAVTMKTKNNQQAKSLGDGVTPFLSPYTDNLLSSIFEMRETGMAVSVNSVVVKALQLSTEFREKTYTARHSTMCRFINVHSFGHQIRTHLSQHQPSEMEEIANDFVCVIHQKLRMS